MVSLARSTLRHEWRRFLPAMFAVAFSGVLMLVQLGLLLGMFGTVSVTIDRSDADLWVGFPGTASVDLGRGIAERNEAFLRLHSDVAAVERFRWHMVTWRRPDGASVIGIVVGTETRPEGMTFARILTPELRRALEEPDGVVVDEGELEKLGVRVGDRVEINGKRVRVVGTTRGIRAIGGVNIIGSLATARRLDTGAVQATEKDRVAYLLLKLRDPERARVVRDELQPEGSFRRYEVWTADEFSRKSQLYWLLESGAGAGFAFSSVLGLVVGIAITSQTLVAAITASLREYATLRALGVSLASLRRVVLEQAFWVGIAGTLVAGLCTAGILGLADTYDVAMRVPSAGVAGTAVLLLITALGSGLLALRALARAEPATLLR